MKVGVNTQQTTLQNVIVFENFPVADTIADTSIGNLKGLYITVLY